MNNFKLTINLENCYGIKKLEHKFDFSECNTFVIYAPNGVMKTSFAKTSDDFIIKRDSRDHVFNREPYLREFLDEKGAEISTNDIFVIKSFVDTGYTSDRLSTLLVRNELRAKYQEILDFLNKSKNELVNNLAENTKSTDCEKEIVGTFSDLGDNFFDILNGLFDEISNTKFRDYSFRYNHVFENDVVKRFIEKNKNNIKLYYDKYFEILSKSDDFFTSDGSFGTAQANGILESIEGDSFFKAGHKIVLKNSSAIKSSEELKNMIDNQIKKILSDPTLEAQFKKIDKALQPKNIQPLKEIIERDKELLLELIDYEEFKKSYWKSHLSKLISEVSALRDLHSEKKKEIEEIIQEANRESETWKKTVKTFKDRFVEFPIKVNIKNTKDSVLGLSRPELTFSYIDLDTNEEKEIDRDDLSQNVLSQGEKRAFYLLNIIFEIQARSLQNLRTLYVIDDIADSFDYKNKYAIVEYLHDIAQQENFYSIILTHNFDFFRTLQSRVLGDARWKYSFIAERQSSEIKLIEAGSRNVTDPFSNWKRDVVKDEKCLIACIPFVRNLIEYREGKNNDYRLLTHVLHQKKEDTTNNIKSTDDICINDLEPIFTKVLAISSFEYPDKSKKLIEVIDDLIVDINKQSNLSSIVLEDKIVLAIGIRLKAEKYMWNKVSRQDPITKKQMGLLFQRYKEEFGEDQAHEDRISILESVNIMTPENIHLNSFMYEPILDMGIDELKNLYKKASDLI